MSDAEVKELMDQIAAELKKGARRNTVKLDRLNDRLNKALGMELKGEDQELAEVWERSHR